MPYTKIDQRSDLRPKIIKLLKENVEKTLWDCVFWRKFLRL